TFVVMSTWCVIFFFSSRRRHTRFSRDWSSDVCSSDLGRVRSSGQRLPQHVETDRTQVERAPVEGLEVERLTAGLGVGAGAVADRSEERRVGKECRAGWGPETQQQQLMR